MARYEMQCTDAQYNGLWDALHKTRSDSSKVTVNKQAFTNLLEDHTHLQDLFIKGNRP